MTNNKYSSTISLTILGPLLTASTSLETYGLQKAFHRDYKGGYVIPDSHIKGKLRMALAEIKLLSDGELEIDLDRWFGVENDDASYEPTPGILKFSNLTCKTVPQSDRRSRVSINSKTLTAAENQLRDVEEIFKSEVETVWTGTISFFADSDVEARKITNALRIGLKWLPTLGAEKGVGFGRVYRAELASPARQQSPILNVSSFNQTAFLHLRIEALEPIITGGVKQPRTNYIRSEQILSGGLIKGALAACLNRAHGVTPIHRELSQATAQDFPTLKKLVEHFSDIRISHAYATHKGQPRPVKKPISIVQVGGQEVDTALSTETYPLVNQRAPTYFIDWKSGQVYWGAVTPKEIFITRTAIDDTSRRSRHNQLFTYSFLCPEDDEEQPIEWVCNVDFAGVPSTDRHQVKVEFAKAVQLYLDRLGKLNHSVRVEVFDDLAPAVQPSTDLIKDEMALVTLQTDALMLNPEDVRKLPPGKDLKELYTAFWQELVGSDCLELDDFYASQTFRGGYLYHRYLGAAEREQHPNRYRPYYLTCAGSVFRLRVLDEAKARQHLLKWTQSGLELPQWAKDEYGQYGNPLWQTCPFVPENGYGEIVVNLKWHWDHKYS